MLPRVTLHELGIVAGRSSRIYLQRGEQEVLVELVDRAQPKAMIEIGGNVGLTAKAMLQTVHSIEQYIGLDVGPEYKFQIPAQARERPDRPGELVLHDPRFELVLRNGAHNDITLRHPCGCVFIDGDHGRDAVRHDTELATRLISQGGLIIWHDYGNRAVEVTPVLDELQAKGRDIVHIKNTWLAFEQR